MFKLWFITLLLSGMITNPIWAAEYLEHHTPHFILFYDAKDNNIARYLISRAEGARQEIIANLGLAFESKTRVYIAPSRAEFRKLQPQEDKSPGWVSALAYPKLNVILLNSPRSSKGLEQDILLTFKHELTHILVGRAFGDNDIPHWLNEGLAMYEAREWDFNRMAHMTQGVLSGRLIPLEELTRAFPLEPQRAALAYAQSFYLVSYLLDKKGPKAFHTFILEYAKGRSFKQVLIQAYGMSPERLEEEWLAHLRFRFSWLPIICSSTGIWFIITLIFLTSYWRKKRANKLQVTDWEMEERDFEQE
jgi:hypothetical protein